MGGFLDAYEGEAQRQYHRARLLKQIIVSVAAVALVAAVLYFTLRTRHQEQVVSQFLEDLKHQQYQDAYKLWGCTPETPCKYYPPDKFTEDWGPSSPRANAAALKVENVDFCNDGVVFDLTSGTSDEIGLWVDRSTNTISFAPWTRCPGRHLQLRRFWKSLFS